VRGGLQTYSSDMHLRDHGGLGLSASDVLPSRGGLVEVRLLSDLRQAISRHALTVLYQPKVDLRSTQVVGARPWFAGRIRYTDSCDLSSFCPWCASMASCAQ
jgi:hypothetical protein